MKYLITPAQYKLPNPRIDGWKKLQEVNARIVDIFVFPPEIFKYFLKNKKLPVAFVKEVEKAAKKVIKESPSQTALVRRAFVVPGLENPPGPRFLGLKTSKDVIKAIKELFRFAIDQKYHNAPGFQVSGWIEPPSIVLDEEKFKKNSDNITIPYGGYGISEEGKINIYSVFGINEGVQSLVADKYEVEFRRNRAFIVKKELPQKNLMLCTTKLSGTKPFNVPVEMQFDQVLSDTEITEVARVIFELSQKYGSQRVEFSVDEKGICFNEVADYWKEDKEKNGKNTQIRGMVRVVNNIEDFQKLSEVAKNDLLTGKIIVEVGQNIIANRNYDVLGALAGWKDNLYVLYPGVAATQHAMRVLTDKGHKAFLIGNQKFEDGDEAQIVVTGGKVRITNLSRTENQQRVSLWDASLSGVNICGGKADRLSKLKIAGYQVPHGLVLTTLLFDEMAKELGISLPVALDSFPGAYQKFEKFPENFKQKIASLVSDYINSGKRFAIRSSATIEDDSKDSMAGMFETCLNISDGQLVDSIIKVLRSSFSPVIREHIRNNPSLAEKMKMAVVIQEMVPARCAGVIFGAKVQTSDLDIVEIEANAGLGEGIVSGQAKEVGQYKFSRSERRMIERKGPELLSVSEAKALFMLSDRLRTEFNNVPQDIEWAIDKQGQIWVLQSRDLYLGK